MNGRGFSLFEVILALAILGGTIAVLGEAARWAMRNAEYTREAARAQLLCESKMSEIVAGLISVAPVQRAVLDKAAGPGEPAWLYSIEKTTLDDGNLAAIRVTVARDLPKEKHPVSFSLVRWLANADTANKNNSAETESTSTDASGGTSTSGD